MRENGDILRIASRLDLKGSNLIKSVNLEGLKIIGDPSDYAGRYYSDGIDEVLLLDSVASLYDRKFDLALIERLSEEIFVPLTVGGGIKSCSDARDILKSGADKVAVNTGAVRNPDLIRQLVDEFGSQCITVSIETKIVEGRWEIFIENGRQRTGQLLHSWINACELLGAGELLVTSIDKEGTGQGFDLNLLEVIDPIVNVPLVISGGMGALRDLQSVFQYKAVSGIAIAHVLHNGVLEVSEIKSFAESNKIVVRKSNQ